MIKTNEWGLTDKEEMFALEYFTTKNATQSYMKAFGVQRPYAVRAGNQLLQNPNVDAFIKHLMDTVRNDKILTAEEVLVGLSEVARGEDGSKKHQKIYAKDKLKALELLAKHYSLLTDVSRQEIEQKVIIVDDLDGATGE